MSLRARIADELKAAMKARDAARVSTLRMINAAIAEREIALRGEEGGRALLDEDILATLARMVKTRQDSARIYDEGGRADLAARERAEIAVIEGFLPRPLDPAQLEAAVEAAIRETGAGSIRDMGRVMAALKARHTGRMDFAQAGGLVKARLAEG